MEFEQLQQQYMLDLYTLCCQLCTCSEQKKTNQSVWYGLGNHIWTDIAKLAHESAFIWVCLCYNTIWCCHSRLKCPQGRLSAKRQQWQLWLCTEWQVLTGCFLRRWIVGVASCICSSHANASYVLCLWWSHWGAYWSNLCQSVIWWLIAGWKFCQPVVWLCQYWGIAFMSWHPTSSHP